jgi:hypothetical protein
VPAVLRRVAEPGAGTKIHGVALAVKNPAYRTAAITYAVPTGHAARLAAFDVNGRQVAEIAGHVTGAGLAVWDLAGVDAGAYFVRLADETSSTVTKVVVTK